LKLNIYSSNPYPVAFVAQYPLKVVVANRSTTTIDRRRLFYAKLLKRMPRLATCKIGFSTGGERIYREKRQFHDLCKICPK
jgi:hypothetical protein